MSMMDSPLPSARVVGPKTTFRGLAENASTGDLKLITAIQKIGKAAIRHQKARNEAEARRSDAGC